MDAQTVRAGPHGDLNDPGSQRIADQLRTGGPGKHGRNKSNIRVTLPKKVFASLGAAQGFATVNSRLKTWQQVENRSTAEVQPEVQSS